MLEFRRGCPSIFVPLCASPPLRKTPRQWYLAGPLLSVYIPTMAVTNSDMERFWAERGHSTSLEHGLVVPLPKAHVLSKAALALEGKTLLAHIVTELGAFPSVGQAKKCGWDRPLEIGKYTANKKRICFEITA